MTKIITEEKKVSSTSASVKTTADGKVVGDKEQKTDEKAQGQEKQQEEGKEEVTGKKEEAKEGEGRKGSKKQEIPIEKLEKEKEKKVKVPEKFKELVKEIESLSVLDLAELVKVLEKKFGVSAAPQMVAMGSVAPGADKEILSPAVQEKTVFNIVLKAIGDKKIEVIKAARDITKKGLKEAKDLVDAVASDPQIIKENVKKEEAEELKKKLEGAGATVELQ